jgi:hypothetical protein
MMILVYSYVWVGAKQPKLRGFLVSTRFFFNSFWHLKQLFIANDWDFREAVYFGAFLIYAQP